MNVPTVFGDITTEEQAADLRIYFKSLGAEISEERSPKGVEDDLMQIIKVCNVCFKQQNEADIESVLNSIVSLLVMMPGKANKLITAFCEKMCSETNPAFNNIALRVLWLLFQSLDERSEMRYHVYCYVIQAAEKVGMIRAVFKDMDRLKENFTHTPLKMEQMQKLHRLLHKALISNKQSDMAAKVMLELLGTYTTKDANHAKEDAKRCIVTALADPNTFLLDPLLSLTPIRALEGDQIFTLLNIFVSEKLSAYLQFYKGHKDYINSLGLDHSQNMKKMRILTFMQLAEATDEIPFETIQKELQISESDVENFIIEVLKTKLVRARMHQPDKKVHISSTMHRTFGLPQWQQLRDVLQSWKSNLATIDTTMHSVLEISANNKNNPITTAAM